MTSFRINDIVATEDFKDDLDRYVPHRIHEIENTTYDVINPLHGGDMWEEEELIHWKDIKEEEREDCQYGEWDEVENPEFLCDFKECLTCGYKRNQ